MMRERLFLVITVRIEKGKNDEKALWNKDMLALADGYGLW